MGGESQGSVAMGRNTLSTVRDQWINSLGIINECLRSHLCSSTAAEIAEGALLSIRYRGITWGAAEAVFL